MLQCVFHKILSHIYLKNFGTSFPKYLAKFNIIHMIKRTSKLYRPKHILYMHKYVDGLENNTWELS